MEIHKLVPGEGKLIWAGGFFTQVNNPPDNNKAIYIRVALRSFKVSDRKPAKYGVK